MSFLPISVLVIEEHPFKQSVAIQVFRDAGCEKVMAAANLAAALEVLEREGPFDIALSALNDVRGRDLTTLDVLSRSKGINAVIVCSDHAADLHVAIDRMIGLLGVKVLGYVDTPVRVSAITTLLARYLEMASVQRCKPRLEESAPIWSKASLEQAITRHEIRAFFQPKFTLTEGDVHSFEVLARWESPEYGLLSPADFLPLLKKFGLMDELFFAQMAQGLTLLQEAQARGRQLCLAFNLESEQFGHTSLLPRVCELLERYCISPSQLTFELTESGLLEISSGVLENLIRLRMMGIGLSIDDFGVGYSSLERLCQLPFTEIKLDANFARDLDTNVRNRAVISSTLALGNALNMQVVVEGVETEKQRQHLIKLGCTQAQGFLCARPMGGQSVLSWLETKLTSPGSI